MQKFVAGQRWINNAELHLGLGTILTVEQRTITILYQATGETRTYAQQSAPLTRVVFAKGDKVVDQDGRALTIDRIDEAGGLLTYTGRDEAGRLLQMTETLLDHRIRLNRPLDRLLTGQIDDHRWFVLRARTRQQLERLTRSRIDALTGGRTDLIPHQLYIADEVGRRYAPRVLLADEVGLGKTIEAGMILHEQLLAERIHRVLIVVPDNLLHQWLIEMLRRFNLRFALFDEERYQAMTEFDATANPFEQEQLVLCGLGLLTGSDDCLRQALAAGWDLLVVDEAHHLQWTPEHASAEYSVIERIAKTTSGVLLLTATPEQLGKAGHYARLRLLDPARFPDFDRFINEEQSYEPVAAAIEQLFQPGELSPDALARIRALLGEDGERLLADPKPEARQQLIDRLLDHHGTGRVLFRNTRAAVKGFPERQPKAYPLPAVSEYQPATTVDDGQSLLSPELYYQQTVTDGTPWTRFDPRIPWLRDLLQTLKTEKVLVICSAGRTALDLAELLRQKYGIAATAFHEHLSIIERDRVAAWFAEQENGAQAMICSEIGSEGRNFQFAHHLVLFDLPLNPDLLEQRIGRLDRIGQRHPVQIHIPYIKQTAQAFMYRWYQDGLNAFARPCRTGAAVFERFRDELTGVLRLQHENPDDLIRQTAEQNRQLNAALEKGRDRLLEYNSCRPEIAAELHRLAQQEDRDSMLADYMDSVFDCFGVHSEEHGASSLILSPAENMLSAFPQLPDEGVTVTFDRATALAHEDRQFLTWSHPMVTGAIDLVLGNEYGNTALVTFKHPGIRPGMLLVECHYVLDSATADNPRVRRHLPSALIRLALDEKGEDQTSKLSNIVNSAAVDRETAGKVVAVKQTVIRALVEHSHKLAASHAAAVIKPLRETAIALLAGETTRLRELARTNPNVREEEIRFFEAEQQAVERLFDSVLPRLDAVRVLIAI